MQDGETINSALSDQALARAHPLTMFGLDALVAGSARLRPENLAICSHGERDGDSVKYAELDLAIGAFVARLRAFDLTPGARILLCCPARAEAIIAITAIIAAGFEVVLAPLRLSQQALVAAAHATGAEALIAPARFERLDFEETLLAVAAQTASIRLLGALSPEPVDGAVDFSLSALRATPETPAPISAGWTPGERSMIGAVGASGAPSFLTQGALLGHGLDLVRKTRRAGAAPIISLVSPGSFGGLIAGPLAALLSGAELHFLAPFKADVFLRLLDGIGPARLVAPMAILPDLARSGLLTNGSLLSCALLSSPCEAALAALPSDACPIIEITSDGAKLDIAMQSESFDTARVA